ncbi:hypothetical protein [Caulobacter sp. 1776]|uniref:hypothetical protein n=1 Tax=Caulobacter sp. 1776 TaxID=3156420 RepID=UPI003394B383
MTDRVENPSGWRLLAGFLLAPVPPVLLGALGFELMGDLPRFWETFIIGLIVFGYAPALFVGLPTYAVLRRKLRLTWLGCILAGAFTAALPWALLAIFPLATEASSNGVRTVVDGHPTWFGLFESLKSAAELAAFGALGGGIFRLIVAGRP